jgi:hypothetical protein
MDNVPAIVPLLEREHRVAESRLDASRKELDDLATDKLKVGLDIWFNEALPVTDRPTILHACPMAAHTCACLMAFLSRHSCLGTKYNS